MLAAAWPGNVDLGRLPVGGKLKNKDYAIVDGETFDLAPTPDHTLREEQDPRTRTDPAWGGVPIFPLSLRTICNELSTAQAIPARLLEAIAR